MFSPTSLRVFLRASAKHFSGASLPTPHPLYVQGQVANNRREYFYFIDHTGALFLDDVKIKNFTSCFKDKAFLKFFFSRLKKNDTSRYASHFPYISPCGGELNYIHAYDTPIVFQAIQPSPAGGYELTYVEGLFKVPFDPSQLCVGHDGHFYHPAPPPFALGLLATKLALNISKHMDHASLVWEGKRYSVRELPAPAGHTSPDFVN